MVGERFGRPQKVDLLRGWRGCPKNVQLTDMHITQPFRWHRGHDVPIVDHPMHR